MVKTSSINRQIILSKYSWKQDKGYFVGIRDGTVTIGGRIGSGDFYETENNKFISDGKWHHLVGIFENGNWRIYIDCQLITEVQTSFINPSLTNVKIPLTIGYNTQNFKTF